MLKALLVGLFSLITISYVFGIESIRWKVQSGFAGEDIEGPFKNMFENIKDKIKNKQQTYNSNKNTTNVT